MPLHLHLCRVWLIAALMGATSLSAAEKLVIVSPHWEGLRYEFARAFSEWHQEKFGTPVEVDWRDLGGSSENVRFVISEFKQSPDGIGVDLFFGGGTDPFFEFVKHGLLQAYRPAALAGIPAQVGACPCTTRATGGSVCRCRASGFFTISACLRRNICRWSGPGGN